MPFSIPYTHTHTFAVQEDRAFCSLILLECVQSRNGHILHSQGHLVVGGHCGGYSIGWGNFLELHV